ncbi:MAG: sulfotransferase [Candidatus Lokiarchaeota archaeon]
MKTVVILCLARSGSSLLSGILHRLGVRMGPIEELVKGTHSNKYGNYENQDFLKLSYKILIQAGSCSLTWADIPNDTELWGWKDPSTIYTLPFFEKYLENPYYIVLKRDVDSMVDSHMNLSKISNWFYSVKYILGHINLKMATYLLWNLIKRFFSQVNIFNDEKVYREVIKEGFMRIDRFVKGKKYIEIPFNDLISDTLQVINRIVRFLDINPSIRQFENAKAFIDKSEIHFYDNIKRFSFYFFGFKSYVLE